MRKTIASLTIGASVLAGAAGGAALFVPSFAGAQEAPTEDAPAEESTRPTFAERIGEALAPLVEDGTITQAQSDAVAQRLEEVRPERGDRGPRGHRGGPGLDVITDVLGLEPSEIRDALAAGDSLADIATANGVDPQALIDAMVAAGNERIDTALANGRIDEAEADEKRAEVVERATALVNGEIDPSDFRGRGHGPRGPHGGDDAAEDTTDA